MERGGPSLTSHTCLRCPRERKTKDHTPRDRPPLLSFSLRRGSLGPGPTDTGIWFPVYRVPPKRGTEGGGQTPGEWQDTGHSDRRGDGSRGPKAWWSRVRSAEEHSVGRGLMGSEPLGRWKTTLGLTMSVAHPTENEKA